MRLTQVLAVINGEVNFELQGQLSHFDPFEGRDAYEMEDFDLDMDVFEGRA